MDYVHTPELAPTQQMLDEYKDAWNEYEQRFLDLIRERRIEDSIASESIDGSCLLCSEEKPHHCHWRLVAEYLPERWVMLKSSIWGDRVR